MLYDSNINTFKKLNAGSMTSGYPVVVDHVNDDGTVQGHLNPDQLSFKEKLIALSDLTAESINRKIFSRPMVR